MASPFPGMDPFLEAHWGDVHASLIIYAKDQLQRVLPRDLRARVEERLVVRFPDRPVRGIVPDVRVFEKTPKGRTPRHSSAALATAATPVLIPLDEEAETQTFLEIRERGGGKLITTLEILSASNKLPGLSREQYLRKQQELLAAGVHLVEIDLVRAGEWVVAVPPESTPDGGTLPFRAVVRRGHLLTRAEYYGFSLRDPLPTIRIPLRPSDDDVPLDLQALLDRCYSSSGYDDDIDYQHEPVPPLTAADARWADTLLRRAGRRTTRIGKKRH